MGIIGPKGAGKTTLFRMLVGAEKPDSGTIKVGATVDIGYVDQNRDALDPQKSVFEEISGGHDTIELGKRTANARSYVAKFNFMGPDQQNKVGTLSKPTNRLASATRSCSTKDSARRAIHGPGASSVTCGTLSRSVETLVRRTAAIQR